MCGRYTLKTDRSKIAQRFGVEDVPPLAARYNLGPTQDGLVVRPGDAPGTRTAALLRWGLIPAWTKNRGSTPLLINARSETAARSPAFREPFKHRRCLVVADGFFEWARAGAVRQPYYFTVNHGEPFAMAGLWESWRPPGAPREDTLETYTILTTTANAVIAPLHDRMPVILDPEFFEDWLNPLLNEADSVARLLQPYPPLRMLGRVVNPRVNNIKFDDPACLESPAELQPENGAAATASAARGAQRQLSLGLEE